MENKPLKTLLLKEREKAFEQLYEQAFPLVAHFISRMGGTLQDARDIFQDSLIVLYEKVLENPESIRISAQAYVLGIARHLWHKKFREGRQNIQLRAIPQELSHEADFDEQPVETLQISEYLKKAGRKCMDILQSFYYQKMSMQEIADTFGYGSTRSATVQKYKCLEKVRQTVKAYDYEKVPA